MTVTVLDGIEEVKRAVGRHLGHSDWLDVGQERVDLFAVATGDDPQAAGVAPYLTVALSNFFLPQIVDVRGMSLGVNYGCNRIRFRSPVPVGSRLRAGAELTGVDDIAGGVQTTITIVIEMEGRSEPACVIESVSRYLV